MSESDQHDETDHRQPSEGPSGFGNPETAGGGADAVPDTPDGVPHEPGEPGSDPDDPHGPGVRRRH